MQNQKLFGFQKQKEIHKERKERSLRQLKRGPDAAATSNKNFNIFDKFIKMSRPLMPKRSYKNLNNSLEKPDQNKEMLTAN